jgi:hypothetical protein
MSYSPFLAPGRDNAAKFGRLKSSTPTTYYSVPGTFGVTGSTQSLSVNIDYFSYWYTNTPLVIDQLVVEVTTSTSGNFRMGLTAVDADLQPVGAPLADSGSIALATPAVKTYTPGTPIYVPPGRYAGILAMDTAATFRTWAAGYPNGPSFTVAGGTNNMTIFNSKSRTYAAFPTPAATFADADIQGTGGSKHWVVYRVKAL